MPSDGREVAPPQRRHQHEWTERLFLHDNTRMAALLLLRELFIVVAPMASGEQVMHRMEVVAQIAVAAADIFDGIAVGALVILGIDDAVPIKGDERQNVAAEEA